MKFTTNSIKSCTARVGILTEFERIPDVSFETPLALIYTKGGSVPHLTKDVFKMVTSISQILSVSLPSTMSMTKSIKDTNSRFSDFVGMKEYINCLTVQDPAYDTPSGFRQLDSISIWTRNGRCFLTANKYMDIIETFKPDFYVVLCDGDTNINSSTRRITKAVNNSKTFFEKCLMRHSASEILKSTGILGAVEGGYDIDARTASVLYLLDKPVTGYVIDGLHNNGPDVKNISSEQIKKIVEHTVSLLPTDKLKVSMGCWNPITVLDLVESGVDIFDTSYPYISAQNSEALTFLCDLDTCYNMTHKMSFKEKRYADDFSPICPHCTCITCKSHTRAYLYHLYNTKELLHAVLLMIHNVQQYLNFFQDIRENIKNGTFDQYKKKINLKFREK